MTIFSEIMVESGELLHFTSDSTFLLTRDFVTILVEKKKEIFVIAYL